MKKVLLFRGTIVPYKTKPFETRNSFTPCTRIKAVYLFNLLFLLFTSTICLAQDVLIGLTPNGGPKGGGTAFSMATTGDNFTLYHQFMNAGVIPYGDLVRGSDGYFYGMTSGGGATDKSTVFKMSSSGVMAFVKHLDNSTGISPYGSLVQASDGNFYGMTNQGGQYRNGTIFSITPDGILTVLKHLHNDSTGGNPRGSLVQGKDGNFYGMTNKGGTYNSGTIIKITPAGTLTVLKHLRSTIGSYPYGNLLQGSDGNFYGMTNKGGSKNLGTIFKMTSTGSFTVLQNLDSTKGYYPQGSLIQAADSNFYGMTYQGGISGKGTIFKLSPSGVLAVIKNLDNTTGTIPRGSLTEGIDGNFYGITHDGGSKGYGTIFKCTPTGELTVLHNLSNSSDGANPCGSLCRSTDGFFYGMAMNGGTSRLSGGSYIAGGTAFKISATGNFTVLVRFPDNDNDYVPGKNLIVGKDGFFYGMARNGSKRNYGDVYKFNAKDSFISLYSFIPNVTGGYPVGGLLQTKDSNFYGMTNIQLAGIFKMTPSGSVTVVKEFNQITGSNPQGSLIEGRDGNIYGMTSQGGSNSAGTIIKITPAGTFTVLKNFDYSLTGGVPQGGFIQGSDGYFYGTASGGGSNGYGTIFKMDTSATFTILANLDYATNGPGGDLVEGMDGNFYGVASYGGTYGWGSVFSMTPTGTIRVLKSFEYATAGYYPKGGLIQGSDGTLYGMTSLGGDYNGGTIFKIAPSGAFAVIRHLNPLTDGSNPTGSLMIIKAALPSTLRINCGGKTQATSLGIFTDDNYFTGSTSTSTYISSIANTTDDALYQNYRKAASNGGSFGYHIPVANGTYTVKLHFAELYFTSSDKRKFNVLAEGATWLSNYDIFVSAGGINRAKVESKTITVTDGFLDLSFISLIDKAAIGAIEMVPVASSVAITNTAPAQLQLTDEIPAPIGTLYPNPVHNTLTIVLQKSTGQIKATITNASGAVISRDKLQVEGLHSIEMNVSTLTAGIYFLTLQSDSGTQTFKFIKK